MQIQNFNDMGLKAELLERITAKGFDKPTPIQLQAIGPVLQGRDVMGQAQTGTGKTAAFGIPMLNNVVKGRGLQGLVVCPTRELAVQIAEEISSLGKSLGIKILPVYGGQSIDIQIRALKRRPEIIIGTPGRMLDHLRRATIKLSELNFVVLDEADEMLDMGFFPDIKKIMEFCPENRQTMLFSATLVEEVRKLGQKFMRDPEVIAIKATEVTIPHVQQYYCKVSSNQKIEAICRILDLDQPPVSLIFCRTKKGANTLTGILNSRGYAADTLHGDMSQRERDNVMERFRRGNVKILVATDLAARGLDVDIITHVYNFDIPEDQDIYVHRIGRTARAGRGGIAISLIEPNQIKNLRMIERRIGKKIQCRILPSLHEVILKRQDSLQERILTTNKEKLDAYLDIADDLLKKEEARYLLAAALKHLASEDVELETVEFQPLNEDTAHIEVPVGRYQGLNPRKIVEFIADNTSLKQRQVGDIDIKGNSTFVEVPISSIDEVYEAFEKYENRKKNNKRFISSNMRHSHSKKAN